MEPHLLQATALPLISLADVAYPIETHCREGVGQCRGQGIPQTALLTQGLVEHGRGGVLQSLVSSELAHAGPAVQSSTGHITRVGQHTSVAGCNSSVTGGGLSPCPTVVDTDCQPSGGAGYCIVPEGIAGGHVT